MSAAMSVGQGLQLTCDPCGVQWAGVAAVLWAFAFMATGIAVCWWIDRTWPQGPWS